MGSHSRFNLFKRCSDINDKKVCFSSLTFLNVILLILIKVTSHIDRLQKDSLDKSSERTLAIEFAVLAQKWWKLLIKKVDFWVMGLGQDQKQHPAVHYMGVSRGRVCGCGC